MLESLDARIRAAGSIDVISFAAVLASSESDSFESLPSFSNFGAEDASGVFSGLDAIRRAHKHHGLDSHPQVWLSTYRLAFLREHSLYQPVGLIMEDFGWKPRVWFSAERFAYIDSPFYAYRRRPGSIMSERSPRVAIHMATHIRSLSQFAIGHKIPHDILRIWCNEWISMLYWFLFHPVSSRKVDRKTRAKALNIVFDDGGFHYFWTILRHASLPRRLALPLLLLAHAGLQFPAIFFFRKIYYPIVIRK